MNKKSTWGGGVVNYEKVQFSGNFWCYNHSSPLAFLETFTTEELIENFVNFTNIFVDININDPVIQALVAQKHCSVFHLNVVIFWSFPNYGCFT